MSNFLIPEYMNGTPTWVPYSTDVQRRIREGAPEMGWEGDERLYVTPRDGAEGYAIGRLNEDGTKALICVSQPPHKLDDSILVWLAEHDTRHVDVMGRVEANNERVRKAADEYAKARVSEAIERTVHGLVRDVGGLY